MTHFRNFLMAAAITLPTLYAGVVNAAPNFGLGLNQVFFSNFETVLRDVENCSAEKRCYTPNFDGDNDPDGFARFVPPGLPVIEDPDNAGFYIPGGVVPYEPDGGNLLVNDLFAGILQVQNIYNLGSTIFFPSPTNQFTGYFLQEVVQIFPTGEDGDPWLPAGTIADSNHIVLGASTQGDPFGIFALAGPAGITTDGPDGNPGTGDEPLIALFVDDGGLATQFESNGTIPQDILVATDGVLWATAGEGIPNSGGDGNIDLDGYAYSHIDLALALENFSEQEAFFALNLITLGPAYNAGLLIPINDTNEDGVGGDAVAINGHTPANAGDPLFVPCPPGVACTDLVATAELENNSNFNLLGGNSPWALASNDPFLVNVPEPSGLALFGLALVGLAGFYRRRPIKRRLVN